MDIKFNSQLQSPLFRLPLQLFYDILKYLSLRDLFEFGLTCKKAAYVAREYVEDVQICVEDETSIKNFDSDYRYSIVLREISPEEFVYPNGNPFFRNIKKLFLSFDGQECGRINLTKLTKLTHLKIRGPRIVLSSNRLPSVRSVDMEDVDSCERQVFTNIRILKLDFDTEEFSQIYNTTEAMALEHIFIKALDILMDKPYVEDVRFEVCLHVDLIKFEKFIDCVAEFLSNYNQSMDTGKITITLNHTTDYKKELEDPKQATGYKPGLTLARRYEEAFERLTITLPAEHYNFKIILKEIGSRMIM